MEPSSSAKNPRAQKPIKRDIAKQKSVKSNQHQVDAPESKSSTDAGALADQGVAAAVKTATEYCSDAPLDVAALMNQAFSWPPNEEENAQIDAVLHGRRKGHKRLPVFKDICPD